MIGYRCSLAELKADLEASVPGWLDRAAARSLAIEAKGRYEETRSIWSEVKAVYMRRQGGEKCAFCERKLESRAFGLGEQAVEHFRPKGRVTPWKIEGVAVTPVERNQRGYYRLAYHPFNYSAACIPCNTSLKGDRFPIAGVYDIGGSDPAEMVAELPLLIYPIGDIDADPESLIEFHGASPGPVAAGGHGRDRALVTIAFFHLDDTVGRGNLYKERAEVICLLQGALEALAGRPSASVRARWEKILDQLQRPASRHANCARSFVRLSHTNPERASAIADWAAALNESSS